MSALPPDPRCVPPPGIAIRRATAGDAAGFAAMNSDEAVLAGLLQVPFPSVEMWRSRLADSEKPDAPQLVLVAVTVEQSGADSPPGGRVVGHAGLHQPHGSPRRRHAAGLGIAVHPDFQRRGVGRALMATLCDYADRWSHWARLELTVFADNAGAIALYRSFGFEHEGRHRGYALRAGVYEDVLAMARLHPRPPRLPDLGSAP
jgi:putative acetyltransferase